VGLNDPDDGSYVVQIFRKGIVHVFPLSDSEHATISVQCFLDGLDGSRSPGGDGYCNPWVYDGIPEW
jgi:hypothetical protein